MNQGKQLIDALSHTNIERNEYELRIQSLTEFDKAKILYNHIWHSGLTPEYVDQLYLVKRYRDVISHRNFNPRLISYITDPQRLERCAPGDYWPYIEESLTNPAQVWENPFIAQEDDFGRAIILLVVLHGAAIPEQRLADAYHRYLALPENRTMNGRHEFLSNIRSLTGSFLNRSVTQDGSAAIDLFNPSIGDFVLARYSGNANAIRLGMRALKTFASILTLRNLRRNGNLSTSHVLAICDALMADLIESDFKDVTPAYIASLCQTYIMCGGADGPQIRTAIGVICIGNGFSSATDEAFNVIDWAIKKGIVAPEQGLAFLDQNVDDATSDEEMGALLSLLSSIPSTTKDY